MSIRRADRDDVVVVVRIADAVFVRAPPSLADAVAGWPGERLLDAEAWTAAAGREGRVLGPAVLAFADAGSLIAQPRAAVPLAPDDARLRRFAVTMTAEEWDEGGLEGDLARRFGVTAGDVLVAVAGYEVWDDAIAHTCVASAAAERGRGHAKAAAGAAVTDAIGAGLVVQWRAAVSNPASLSVGEAIGCVRLGLQLTIVFG